MTATISKERVEEHESGIPNGGDPTASHIDPVAICVNPAVGREQVIDYIVGDLNEDAHREFVDHVAECGYCLREVVLWRTAQVLAEEDAPRTATQSA